MNQVLESLPVVIAASLFCGVGLAAMWRTAQRRRCSSTCRRHRPAWSRAAMIGPDADDERQWVTTAMAQCTTAVETFHGGASNNLPDASMLMRAAALMREQERAAVLRTGCWQNGQQRRPTGAYFVGADPLEYHYPVQDDPVQDDTNYAPPTEGLRARGSRRDQRQRPLYRRISIHTMRGN